MAQTISIHSKGKKIVTGVPQGFCARFIADLACTKQHESKNRNVLFPSLFHIAQNEKRLELLVDQISFFAPDIQVLCFPAWDCLPYDRISPSHTIVGKRISTLCALAQGQLVTDAPVILISTIHAVLQRLPPRRFFSEAVLKLVQGQQLDIQGLAKWLVEYGYQRVSSVRDPVSFAVRGGILDLFPSSFADPIRLDFFGDSLESIRTFDPDSQRSISQLNQIQILPASEIYLDDEAISRFRTRYLGTFGATVSHDPLYEAVTSGRRPGGIEHWLPLFHETMEALCDYVGDAVITFDEMVDIVCRERLDQIKDHYQSRLLTMAERTASSPPYRPLPPESLFLNHAEKEKLFLDRSSFYLFSASDIAPESGVNVIERGVKQGRQFIAERSNPQGKLFESVALHITKCKQNKGVRIIITCRSESSRERMRSMLADYGIESMVFVSHWVEVQSMPVQTVCLAVLDLENGFESDDSIFISEQDILGERFSNTQKRKRNASKFLSEVVGLSSGDLVVHVDHGIGRFEGLRMIDVAGASHDCLQLAYADGGKLYLPVENIELLSRYGSDETGVQLDRLGAASWQNRKARLKKHISEMAKKLIQVASARKLKNAPALSPTDGMFDEFCARFPFEETEDQEMAIRAVLDDMASGRPMDRLICGDVGFGKTEVALRAAFVAAMSGLQVALVAPTTLLARQHFHTFCARFRGEPLKIEQITRLVPAKNVMQVKKGLETGDIDIVIGTHSLFNKSIKFRRLGLLVIDEEQHFGVEHKERLKRLRADVHVLTLTATPIPRTLQLALSGVRDLSIIASPPVDRLAVRTFVVPFDPILLRDALLQEKNRGGQIFYVCPRISDIEGIRDFLQKHVPEVKVAVAHGQMAHRHLEDVMNAFYEGQFDVLLSTSIVESGLDVPTANTLIVHRADMFGLSQLYQIRGRVGRSKIRAHAFLTLPPDQHITPSAEKRLKLLQSIDSLGAGFVLASHDLDIRGGGNLLGEEQSGHIREVGFELYQHMLEEEIERLQTGEIESEDQWSPQLSVGASVCIPDSYITDLDLRLSLYKRLSGLQTTEAVDMFWEELEDRFGSPPDEVNQLLKIISVKLMCRSVGIEKLDAAALGVTVTFRKDYPIDTKALLSFIAKEDGKAKLRPDHCLVIKRNWETMEERFDGIHSLLREFHEIVGSSGHTSVCAS